MLCCIRITCKLMDTKYFVARSLAPNCLATVPIHILRTYMHVSCQVPRSASYVSSKHNRALSLSVSATARATSNEHTPPPPSISTSAFR